MKKLINWILSFIVVVSGDGFVATIEMLNWVPAVCAIICVLTFIISVYIEPSEFIENETEGSRYDVDV